MKNLYLIRGLPGSGKTTFAKTLHDALPNSAIFSTDDYMVDDNGEYKFSGEKLKHCHNQCQTDAKKEINSKNCINIIIHNTFTQLWEMKPYIDIVENSPFRFKITVIHIEGDHGNTHNIPNSKINKMKNRWQTYPV